MAYGDSQGLINTLFTQKLESKKEVNSLMKRIKDLGNIKSSLTEKEAKLYSLHPTIVRSFIFNSEEKFLNYSHTSSCRFMALMDQKLLNSHHKATQYVPLQDIGGNDILVSKSDFFKFIYEKRCPKFAKRSLDFSKERFTETLKSLKLDIPETKSECTNILDKWKASIDLPFVCSIPNRIIQGEKAARIISTKKDLSLAVTSKLNDRVRESDYYKSKLTTLQRQYFASMCQGLANESSFCTNYTTKDYWALAINGKAPRVDMNYLCNDLFQKPYNSKLSNDQLRKCASTFRTKPSTCMKLSNVKYPSLYPKENCHNISKALINARLRLNFKECPGMIENSHVTTLFRTARNKVKEVQNLPLETDPLSCHSQAFSDLHEIYTKAQLADTWPMDICYDDKIEGKEVCKAYIPGTLEKNLLSEEKVVTSILYRLGKIDKSVLCKVSNESEYNPVLMRYKTGCHIINKKHCYHSDCKKKLIIDEKELNLLSFRGHMAFDYFPLSWQTQRKSFQSLLDQRYDQEQNPLRNFTQLNSFFASNKKAIVHGLGCIEDLLPTYFTRLAIGQCTTHSFIIDGIIQDKGQRKVIFRSPYDDLRSPRLISWNQVFNAVMNQQNAHPLRQWNLYGLK